MRDLGHYRNVANRAAVGPIEDILEYLANEEIHHAYSTQTGHPFQRKLDTRSTPTWTVGAKRRAG